ncbi:MAG: hypothetical protein KDB14_17605 [Planctomycetales bacterium]|nr:hypothetical protein [Planctomycetales bacterium]
MPQHHRYSAVDHGNYYFRPYNYRHIRVHQEAVTSWGGDPRNPYSNEIFETIYAEGVPAAIQWDDVPVQMPKTVAPAPTAGGEPPVPTPIVDPSASLRVNQLRLMSANR